MPDTPHEEPNPFAAPQSDEREHPDVRDEFDDPRMPGSVILASACVTVVLLFTLLLLMGSVFAGQALAGFYLVTLILGVLVLIGLVARNRLAWQWGRIVGALGAALATLMVGLSIVGMVLAVQTGQMDAAFAEAGGRTTLIVGITIGIAMLALPTLCLWVAFFALGRPSARRYFRLVCPSCESHRVRAVGFLFHKARCRRCHAVW